MKKNTISVNIFSSNDPNGMNFSRRHDEGDMPIILVPDDVPFPGVPTHVQLKMKGAMKTAKLSEKKQLTVALIPVKNSVAEGSEDRELEYEDVMHMGVAAVVIHVMTMPDGTETAFVSATNRIGLDSIIWTKGLAEGHVTSLTEIPADHDDMEYMVTTQQIRSTVNEIGEMDDKANPELIATLLRHQEPSLMVNCIAGQFPLTAEEAGELYRILYKLLD